MSTNPIGFGIGLCIVLRGIKEVIFFLKKIAAPSRNLVFGMVAVEPPAGGCCRACPLLYL
jgi:hypothetical protein